MDESVARLICRNGARSSCFEHVRPIARICKDGQIRALVSTNHLYAQYNEPEVAFWLTRDVETQIALSSNETGVHVQSFVDNGKDTVVQFFRAHVLARTKDQEKQID